MSGKDDMSADTKRRLVISSNRLPVSVRRKGGRLAVEPSSGGLVTAMGPVLRNRGGLWIGWPGISAGTRVDKALARESTSIGYDLTSVHLEQRLQELFYFGFSNEIIWPLFHGLLSLCKYDPEYWTAYRTVNTRFAKVINEHAQPHDYIWIHDYHLMSVGAALRDLSRDSDIGFFLHIPFPPWPIFNKLPWAEQILADLLKFNLIGFQTAAYRQNFLDAVRQTTSHAEINARGAIHRIQLDKHEVRVGAFPISIDYSAFEEGSLRPEVRELEGHLHNQWLGRSLMLGVDRLDYTKGIPYRLEAFRRALQLYPELRRKISLVQVVVPSREDIPMYHQLKEEIDQLVGEINGQFTEPGWIPIHYLFRSLSRTELLAFYRSSQIALVTPLEDGMNLVAKEYCAASNADDSVLILSKFAGARAELERGALMVNPYDTIGVAEAIYQAFHMDPDERRQRMLTMKRQIKDRDIFYWVDSFLRAAIEVDLGTYPQEELPADDALADVWFEGREEPPI